MDLSELILDRDGLAAAIACEEQKVNYNLYEKKALQSEGMIPVRDVVIGYGRWGDSKHFHP